MKEKEVSGEPVVEAIILAGGFGTRLRSAVPDLPKCMAPVAGRPFLYYVIRNLQSQGIEKFIFSLGYKHDVVETWLADEFHALDYQCVIESEPLGTGGAIRLACQHASSNKVLVTNGDTIFRGELPELQEVHYRLHSLCTLGLKPMKKFDRYGTVSLEADGRVNNFSEKKYYEAGLINGGYYLLDLPGFLSLPLPDKFSFEKEFLEPEAKSGRLSGVAQDNYFIDIGIPEDFNRAQEELKLPPLDLGKIDSDWSLFLDRDGVINEDKPGSYIFSANEFVFMHGAPALFRKLRERFGLIFVATNQRGVGRGLMTESTLSKIHEKMSEGIEDAGGGLDAIYYATSIHNKDPYRKPNAGMALRAKKEFPTLELSKSIMIGNNISDMQFGRSAGMYTVFVRTTTKELNLPHPDIDLIFDSLEDFAKAL